MTTLSDRIRFLRKQKIQSTTQLANEFGKSEGAIRMWESGRTKPDADTLVKLAEYFECSSDYLLGLSDIKKTDKTGTTYSLNELAEIVHQNAVEHGWWDEERSFPEIIALCHSELSEALEEYRSGKQDLYFNCDNPCSENKKICTPEYDKCLMCNHKKPEGIPIELADCIIRILDYCGKAGIDIDTAIRIKHEYNKTRPYKNEVNYDAT